MKPRRRQLSKAELVHRLVPALRPKLPADQVRDLSLVHHVNLDSLHDGSADETLMWQWYGGVLTWYRVAERRQIGLDEMRMQRGLCRIVVKRFRATGRVSLTEPEYKLATDGVVVMDELARGVDQATAIAAADWSERLVNEIAQGAAV